MTLFVLISVLLCALVNADQFGFTLQYNGSCVQSATYLCSLKAKSQSLNTRISPDGTVNEDIHTVLGVLSASYFEKPNQPSRYFSGNATFGIHSTHQDHTLSYSGTLTDDISEAGNGLVCFGGSGRVSAGTGSWNGASGVVSLSACIEQDDGFFSGVLTARVFVPTSK